MLTAQTAHRTPHGPRTGWALHSAIKCAQHARKFRVPGQDSAHTKYQRNTAISASMTGVPQPWKNKKIKIAGVVYSGYAAVTKHYGISRTTVWKRINDPDWNWTLCT